MKDLKRAFGSPDPDFQDRVRQTLFQIEEKEETYDTVYFKRKTGQKSPQPD